MTDWTEEARRLLPCLIVYGQSCPNPATTHYDSCPATFRPTVAAALAKAEVRGAENTEDICPKCGSSYVRFKQDQRQEIAQLRAERDAAVVQGLEIAARIVAEYANNNRECGFHSMGHLANLIISAKDSR